MPLAFFAFYLFIFDFLLSVECEMSKYQISRLTLDLPCSRAYCSKDLKEFGDDTDLTFGLFCENDG